MPSVCQEQYLGSEAETPIESRSPLRLGGIRSWKRLTKSERLGRWTLGAKELELGNGLSDAWPLALPHPPQDENRLVHALEPFPTAAQDFHMCRTIDVLVERLDIAPHGHVDEHVRVFEWTNRSGVA